MSKPSLRTASLSKDNKYMQQTLTEPETKVIPIGSSSTAQNAEFDLKINEKSALQSHILFWDRDNDNIIHPWDVYNGFRALRFSVPFSILSLLIPFFFSYPTRLGHSYLPDPLFRIYVSDIHKAKHGSDTGIYDIDGQLRNERFEWIWKRFDRDGVGGLGIAELLELVRNDRVALDVAGWTFAYMEWGTTWLLLQKGGKVWKEDLRQAYDGTLFWRIEEEIRSGRGWRQGYGWKEAMCLVLESSLFTLSLSIILLGALTAIGLSKLGSSPQ
jgi:peroxygenase